MRGWFWNYWNWDIRCVHCWILYSYDLLWRWCRSVCRGNFVVQAWSHILSSFFSSDKVRIYLCSRHSCGKWEGKTLTFWAESRGLFASCVFCECLVLLSWLAGLWWGLDHVAGTSYPSGKLLRLSDSPKLLMSFHEHTCVKWKTDIRYMYMLKVPLTSKPRRDLSQFWGSEFSDLSMFCMQDASKLSTRRSLGNFGCY